MKKLLCFAHRGASGHEPENTLSAVEKAIVLGTDWIEVDAYAVEGELIVIHDERLERTTNGAGYVMDKTLAYLRSLLLMRAKASAFQPSVKYSIVLMAESE